MNDAPIWTPRVSKLDTVAPHWPAVLRYAEETEADPGICELTRLSARRFLDDLRDPRFDFRPSLPEFVLSIMEGLLVFSEGDRLDGTPLQNHALELMPWHVFNTYNQLGFRWADSGLLRFVEGGVFAPRKTVKTIWANGMLFGLSLWFRRSGPKAKSVAGSLKQGMEGFQWLVYNTNHLGLTAPNNPPGKLRLLDSSLGHRISGPIWGGTIDLETLAFKPELFDAFNASLIYLDELELYKDARPYARLRDATKAKTNKLILTTFTAGDDGTGFAAQHRDYLEKILRGAITGLDADRMCVFMAEAPKAEDGSVDYTDPAVHRAANPAYGITIRPEDMIAQALQAEHNPALRKEFLTRSLNVFVSSYKAAFDLEEFRRSDRRYGWTQAEAAELIRAWYGGSDLSLLHDLTAACICGEIPAARAATADWTPPEDVLVLLPHCWFPLTAAAEKADRDNIPLFGWQTDGWLDMPNTESMDPAEPVKQYKAWRSAGFRIRQVGHDRKFARRYCQAMEAEGFKISDQPQLHVIKSEGFRYIEHKAKVGCLYYFHAEPFEYCVSNVTAVADYDETVKYKKISETQRIDVFDAAVFATCRLLISTDKSAGFKRWLDAAQNNNSKE